MFPVLHFNVLAARKRQTFFVSTAKTFSVCCFFVRGSLLWHDHWHDSWPRLLKLLTYKGRVRLKAHRELLGTTRKNPTRKGNKQTAMRQLVWKIGDHFLTVFTPDSDISTWQLSLRNGGCKAALKKWPLALQILMATTGKVNFIRYAKFLAFQT